MPWSWYECDYKDKIIAAPKSLVLPEDKDDRAYAGRGQRQVIAQMNHDKIAAKYASFYNPNSWIESLTFDTIKCKEHGRWELVPTGCFQDVRIWYDIGLHPRFSVNQVLIDAKQRHGEMWQLTHRNGEAREEIVKAMRGSRKPSTFHKKIKHLFFVNLYWRGRRYRVSQDFKKKHQKKAFTSDDFLAEDNQERRRIMLWRGVSIQEVLGKMNKIAEDNEGAIYEYNNSRYLHVVCPSTAQEYLLGIPQFSQGRSWDSEKNGWTEPVELKSPSEARRWTFGLPAEAKFVKEA